MHVHAAIRNLQNHGDQRICLQSEIKLIEITPAATAARYSIVTKGCAVGAELAIGGSCTDVVRLNIDKPNCPNTWFNNYFIEVAEVGMPNNVVAGNAQLIVP